MNIEELNYNLPEELIAQSPPEKRGSSKLLVLSGKDSAIKHHHIQDLPSLLPSSLLIFNDTRVFPARLYAKKPTGGKVEFLLIEPITNQFSQSNPQRELWLALGKTSKGFKPGAIFQVGEHLSIEINAVNKEGLELWIETKTDQSIMQAIEEVGHVPLPPYVRREANKNDKDRYQTVFAKHSGSVAAPTAGLHFTNALIQNIKHAGHQIAHVTLHVGPGTFAPVRTASLETHPMHTEHYSIPEQTVSAIETAKKEKRPVIAIGTTVVRTLEAAANTHSKLKAGSSKTNLLIYPPYSFKVIDGLFTNFHLPKSTLLALVMAFAGKQNTKSLYQKAIEHRYRFFSYGDAMLIYPRPNF